MELVLEQVKGVELIQIPQGSWDWPRQLVLCKVKIGNTLQVSKRVGNWTGELVPTQVQAFQVKLRKRRRDIARKFIEREFQVFQVFKLGQEVGYWAGYTGPADREVFKLSELGDSWLDGAGNITEVAEEEDL